MDCTKLLQGVEQNKASKTKIEAIENNDDKVPPKISRRPMGEKTQAAL